MTLPQAFLATNVIFSRPALFSPVDTFSARFPLYTSLYVWWQCNCWQLSLVPPSLLGTVPQNPLAPLAVFSWYGSWTHGCAAARMLLAVWETGGIETWGGDTVFLGPCSVTVYCDLWDSILSLGFSNGFNLEQLLPESYPSFTLVWVFLIIAGSVYAGFGRRRCVGSVD